MLVGGDGNDSLQGVSGKDLLIGGAGGDTFARSTGNALSIAGSTAFDLDPAALSAILAEWANPRHSLAQKIASLQGVNPPANRLNGSQFLITSGAAATVFDDAESDWLNTTISRDWWLVDLARDRVSTRKK